MKPLDGNAIAGALAAYFGREMTSSEGACAHCGTSAVIAELRVYDRAPGAVVRCPSCLAVVMVVVTIRDETRVDLAGFRLGQSAG
jgi:hypothetical protein